MTGRLADSDFAPWGGLFGGALGWWLHHEVGAYLAFYDCSLGGPVLTVGLALACGALVAAGVWVSWRAFRAPAGGGPRDETRRFAALVGFGAAGLFSLAILYQTLAGFILTGCLR